MMSESLGQHPSYWALDSAKLGLAPDAVLQHVEQCRECRDYVQGLDGQGTDEGLRDVARRIERSRGVSRRTWLGAASVVSAAAAAAVFYVRLRPQPDLPASQPYIGEKGFTSVWIYVRHGAATALWDGKKPVFPGDRLRLKVDPGRFKHLEVYSTKDPSRPELLYQGVVSPGQSTTLPDAWEVDAEPGEERLLVVFSSQPVKPLWDEWLEGRAPAGVMLLPFSLPKAVEASPKMGPQ